ncbi:MAG: TIGR03663 family protein [Sedimentisphaerales bacterium]|nr:TIGR03663 family protein [Sedimentisphaerales bacterium]
MKRFWLVAAFLLIGAAAAGLRLYGLSLRPMHPDEAVHAGKFGTLLERGYYTYDPHEYHGPVLNYLSLIPAWFCGVAGYPQTTEAMLRIVPATASILLVLLFFTAASGLGRIIALISAALMGVSPIFVFYGRYYIQETLLVFFTAGFIFMVFCYLREGKWPWAVIAGVFLGMMHASKETFIISLVAMIIAAFITCCCYGRSTLKAVLQKKIISWGILFVLLAAMAVSVLFYSSFFTNPRGILDSLNTFSNYVDFAQQRHIHFHPWYYYFQLLIYSKSTDGMVWSEIFILLFALAGFVFTLNPRNQVRHHPLLRFIAVYTLIMMMIYSFISYKTPWCMLGFMWGLIIMAGVGIVGLYRHIHHPLFLTLMTMVITFGAGHLAWQAYMQDVKYYADPGNPYVYAHTSTDIFKIINQIETAAVASTEGENVRINVISDENYWPLPWYLRKFRNVGWFNAVNKDYFPATITIASPSLEDEIITALYQVQPVGEVKLYVPLFKEHLEIRPGVELRGYITKELWDRMEMPADKDMPPMSYNQTFQPPDDPRIDPENKPKVFSHEAMATVFEIYITHPDMTYAEQAAITAFRLLDEIEADLSRFIPNSDISRINSGARDDIIRLNQITYECLEQALLFSEKTFGAFEVNLGMLIKDENNTTATDRQFNRCVPLAQAIRLDKKDFFVKILNDNLKIDLGGIGKGFAIDRMIDVLQQWGIEYAFIHSGTSTARALQSSFSQSGWTVNVTNPFSSNEIIDTINLENNSMGCSGTIQRRHIIDPRTSTRITAAKMVWVTCLSAAEADALATALIVMNREEADNFFEVNGNYGAVRVTEAKHGSCQIERWGNL